MNIEELRDYCLQQPAATEDMPFGDQTLVFKVGAKIFLLVGLENGDRFNAKCDPDWAIELREQHTEIVPGFHMNKKHWNTIICSGQLTDDEIKDLVRLSYDLVVKG